jgi:glycosyltransferase involved in cell wall biosynthesis
MRILFFPPGGIAAERPLQWLVNAGHEVCLVRETDFYPNNPPANYRFVSAAQVIHGKPDVPMQSQDLGANLSAHAVRRFKQLAAEFQPDIILTAALDWQAYCCAVADLHPFVVLVWGYLNVLLPERNEPQSELSQYITSNADVLIVENPKLVELTQAIAKPTAKVSMLPLGVDTKRFYRGATQDLAQWKQKFLDLQPEDCVLLSPRGMGYDYGQDYIMDAYAIAYPHFQRPTALVFSGMPRTSLDQVQAVRDKIQQRAEAANVSDRIRWLTHLPYLWMPTLYNLADVVVNYLSADAFPATLLEAAACECPIISSDISVYRDTFIEQFAWLVPPRNPQALAETMIQVVNQAPQQRQPQMTAMRQQMMAEYEEAIWAARLVQTCEQAA